MRILLTNDDGIHAAGLWAMAETLSTIASVSVVAPDRDQSGLGTARSLRSAIRIHSFVSPTPVASAVSVEGTPSDCVILATEMLDPNGFDMVFSGINEGANLGMDILASGTVGAALQGYLRGIPSIAISLTALTDLRLEIASIVARSIAKTVAHRETMHDRPIFLNVNVPNIDATELKSVELTSLGPRVWGETVESNHNGNHDTFWIRQNLPMNKSASQGTDVWAVSDKRISITAMNGSLSSIEGPEVVTVIASDISAILNVCDG